MKDSCFQLKGSLFTLSVLQITKIDWPLLEQELREKLKQAPNFFSYAPVVLDFQKVDTHQINIDFASLNSRLRALRFVPVGVRGLTEGHLEAAQVAGFAVLIEPSLSKEDKAASDIAAILPKNSSRLITTPIRSGQQVHAQGGDLVVLGPVSPGAELLADGHIHVYGTLRGRALAGISGDQKARIFCHQLAAELVSIAGQYKIFEDFSGASTKGPIQIYVEQDQLIISSL